MPMPQEKIYTTEDIYALPDGQRAELIDGRIYDMAPPSFRHQKILMELSAAIHRHIKSHGGNCEVLPAPFAVFLNKDDLNYVEPDISVVCDKSKLDDKGCNGAPDWVIEIASPGSSRVDYGIKLFKYRSAGVREYWIVNPKTYTINLFDFENNAKSGQFGFDEDVPVCIFDGFLINISDLLSH